MTELEVNHTIPTVYILLLLIDETHYYNNSNSTVINLYPEEREKGSGKHRKKIKEEGGEAQELKVI